jgi:DNA-binding MarR family transcriptional regulator
LSAALALVLVVSLAASAEAQLRGLRFPASLQNVFLLRGEEVQKELNLNDEQRALLADIAMKLQQDAFEIFSGLQDLTPEEQKEAMPDVMKMIDEKGKETQSQVDDLLDETQRHRLKELSFQARGAQALEDDEVVTALAITDEQKKKLADIREEGSTAIQTAFQKLRAGGGDQGEIRKQIGEMRKQLNEKALAVLTPEQLAKFEKMKGAEFKFPPSRGFPF